MTVTVQAADSTTAQVNNIHTDEMHSQHYCVRMLLLCVWGSSKTPKQPTKNDAVKMTPHTQSKGSSYIHAHTCTHCSQQTHKNTHLLCGDLLPCC